MVVPFIQIMYDYSETGIILPTSLPAMLDANPNFQAWARACRGHENCLHLWDKNLRRTRVEERLGRMRPGA